MVDLPTAFYITGAEIDDGMIVGQLPQVGAPEQFGLRAGQGLAADRLRQQGGRRSCAPDGTLADAGEDSGWPQRGGAPPSST